MDKNAKGALEEAIKHVGLGPREQSVAIICVQRGEVKRFFSYSGSVEELRAVREGALEVAKKIEEIFWETGTPLNAK